MIGALDTDFLRVFEWYHDFLLGVFGLGHPRPNREVGDQLAAFVYPAAFSQPGGPKRGVNKGPAPVGSE